MEEKMKRIVTVEESRIILPSTGSTTSETTSNVKLPKLDSSLAKFAKVCSREIFVNYKSRKFILARKKKSFRLAKVKKPKNLYIP